jgi:hypothetical protein
VAVFDVDAVGVLARELMRERVATLVAEACAWSVGLSDAPHLVRRHGRVVATGTTLGGRAAAGLPLSGEEDRRLELGEPRVGTFADALGALTDRGTLYADALDERVLAPFVRDTCLSALDRARAAFPDELAELLEEVGEDGTDPMAVVRAAEWEAPLRIEAERLAVTALGDLPLIEVEAEGLSLSLVRAAEDVARSTAPVEIVSPETPLEPGVDVEPGADPGSGVDLAPGSELAGALFLAEAAVAAAGLTVPVPPAQAASLLTALERQGLEAQEVLEVLPHLPVQSGTAEQVATALGRVHPPGEP